MKKKISFYGKIKGFKAGQKLFMTFNPLTFKSHYFMSSSMNKAVGKYIGRVVHEANTKWERFQYLFGLFN